jgi:MIP family channel proteins
MHTGMLRSYFAEFIGTFALVFFGCGTRAMVGDVENFAGILVVHIAFAFTIAAMIYTLSYLSSAHFNPAVTLGFAISKHFPWRYVIPYWLAQFGGALLASTCHFMLFPEKAAAVHFGATTPKVGIVQALAIEIILTFFLMLVSMASATDKRFVRADSGLTIGFTILVSGLFANSLSGGSMNPARSLAPALFAGGHTLASVWIYLLGPLVGALLGAIIYEILRGSQKHTRDVLADLPLKEDNTIQPELPLKQL